MKRRFLSETFLLQNECARKLYFDFARDMPIFDYHCHLPVSDIAGNRSFSSITELWLERDHYKWRAMRTKGMDERFITGNASDFEKFFSWARTVPSTVRNPLYHWTHMELKTYFHIADRLLNEETAVDIYKTCNSMLQSDGFRARPLLERMNVTALCTTDDPVDDLAFHKQIARDRSFSVKVLPAFRPDRAIQVENPDAFNEWTGKLEEKTGTAINTLSHFVSALRERHNYFHDNGCRISDHGIEYLYAEDFSERDIKRIFDTLRAGNGVSSDRARRFKFFMLRECALMDTEKGWVQQLHFGVLRNNNTRYMELLGLDSGFDCMGDFEVARPLVKFLDSLDRQQKLPKTILYNINPRDNDLVVSITGSFQDGSVPGKIQFGPGWWFNDTKRGMIRHMNALSDIGLLSLFIGMTTDSRSFLSFPRHDYFRRILCNLFGEDVERGELPDEPEFLGKIIQDICYNNALEYFGIE